MRPLVLLSLLATIAACDAGRSVGPESARITVRLKDDRGEPVDRTQIILTRAATPSVITRSGSDGNADIAVADAGVYRVQVIPREGYVGGTEGLSKEVTVSAHATTMVWFTVHRAGSSGAEPPEFTPW